MKAIACNMNDGYPGTAPSGSEKLPPISKAQNGNDGHKFQDKLSGAARVVIGAPTIDINQLKKVLAAEVAADKLWSELSSDEKRVYKLARGESRLVEKAADDVHDNTHKALKGLGYTTSPSKFAGLHTYERKTPAATEAIHSALTNIGYKKSSNSHSDYTHPSGFKIAHGRQRDGTGVVHLYGGKRGGFH